MDHPENDAQYAGLAVKRNRTTAYRESVFEKDADSETSILYSL